MYFAMTNAHLDDKEIIFHILKGLGSNYNEIQAVIYPCDSPISFKEFHDKFFFTMKLILSESHYLLILLIKLILVTKTRFITSKTTVQTIILETTCNNVTTKVLTNLVNNSTTKSHVKYITCKAILLRNVFTCKLLFYKCFNLRTHLIIYILLHHY